MTQTILEKFLNLLKWILKRKIANYNKRLSRKKMMVGGSTPAVIYYHSIRNKAIALSSPIMYSTNIPIMPLSSCMMISCSATNPHSECVSFTCISCFTSFMRNSLAPYPLSVPYSLPTGYSFSLISNVSCT